MYDYRCLIHNSRKAKIIMSLKYRHIQWRHIDILYKDFDPILSDIDFANKKH